MLKAENSMNVIMGQLQLPTQGSTGGIMIGDCHLYRISANKFTMSDFLIMNTTMQIQFRDVAIFISSKEDGHLDLDADVSIDLNAPRIEVDEYIEHAGDMDTFIRFMTNRIYFCVGNVSMIDFNATALGFFGEPPVTQATHLADPTDLATCITAISTLIDELKAYGLMAADP